MSSGEVFGHMTFAALLFLIMPVLGQSRKWRALVMLACVGAAFVPVAGLSPGDYTRSYTDDLAITTLLWLGWSVLARVLGLRAGCRTRHRQLVVTFGVLALVLYPATLGLSSLDPYRLGFSPGPLVMAMWVLCLWFLWRKNYLGLGLICVATAAWLLDVKDSDNYWDYLIDPILGAYSVGCMISLAWRGWRARRVGRGPSAAAIPVSETTA